MSEDRRFLLILWSAMVVSILVYFVVASTTEPVVTAANPSFATAMLVASIAMVAASFAARKRFPLPRVGFILAIALCEAAALLGLMVRFLSGSPDYYLMMLIGLGGMILHFPRATDSGR